MGARASQGGIARRMPCLVAAVLVACSTGVVQAGVRVEDSVQTYRVAGDSSRALWDQMHRLGPLDETEHRRFAALTHWYVSWHYWYRSNGNECHIDRFEVTLSAQTTLPEWADEARGPPALRAEWADFITRLRGHESGHRANGLQAAESVERSIESVGHNRDCSALGQAIDAAGHAAIARANRADIDYDARTQHGATQGAVLP
jgi:predicted secreted Zn-dependent protease